MSGKGNSIQKNSGLLFLHLFHSRKYTYLKDNRHEGDFLERYFHR